MVVTAMRADHRRMKLVAIFAAVVALTAPELANAEPAAPSGAVAKQHVDRSGRKVTGKASFYAKRFAGRKMADGTRMNPHANNAASKTLPLGTTAKVTNLETNQSAVVTIQDRGPYVKGRIIDLSPATAQQIGITPHDGIAKVEVAPLALPPLAQR